MLATVVTSTTLETSPASLLYLAASIDVAAAAGIAETRMTTERLMPLISNSQTTVNPIPRPIPNLRKEASSVVGTEVIFTLDRLKPSVIKTSGIAIIETRSSELYIRDGTSIFRKFNNNPSIAA